MAIDWISTRDRLPPPDQLVLVRHRYRLNEYVPYGLGIIIDGGWQFTVTKITPTCIGEMHMAAHTAYSAYITHWAEITAPAQGMTQEERAKCLYS